MYKTISMIHFGLNLICSNLWIDKIGENLRTKGPNFFFKWNAPLFKGGLISESLSLGYIFKKMCKITSMYSKHRYLNSLGRWWSGW